MIKSEKIKTDQFFVGKKGEKMMYLIDKTEFIFKELHNSIDASIERNERRVTQRNQRRMMRKHCFEIYLFEDDFDYKLIHQENLPPFVTMKEIKHNFVVLEDPAQSSSELVGYYRGMEHEMLDFVKRFYQNS